MGDRLARALPRVGWGAVVASAFLIPVAWTGAVADAFSLPKAAIWWIATALALAGVATDAIARRAWPFPKVRVAIPLGVLVGWTALATLLSDRPLTSWMGQYGRYDGFLELLCGAATMLAIVSFAGRDPRRLASLAWAFVAAAGISMLAVVVEGLGWDVGGWPVADGSDVGIVGLAGNANFSGALLALAVPVVLALRSQAGRPWQRAAGVGAAVALAGGVVWTETRGGILALVAGVAAMGALAPELLPRVVRFGAVVALVAGFVLVGASSLSDPRPGPRPSGVERLLVRSSLGERQNVWAGATAMVRSSPLVGVGPDAFGGRFAYERPSRPGNRALIVADEAHDVFLDRAATAGLPALAAYLWMVGAVAVVAWRGRGTAEPEHRWLLAAFGGACAGYLAQGAFSIDVVPLAWVAWASVGAIVALADPAVLARRGAAESEPTARSVPAPALAGVVVVLLTVVALAVRPLIADRHARLAASASSEGRPLDAYVEWRRAASWLGHEPGYVARQGDALVTAAADTDDAALRRTLLDEALVAYDQALDRAPGDAAVRGAQAQAHLLAADAAADPSVASEHLAAALAIDRSLMRASRADDALHLDLGRALEARAGLADGGATASRDRDLAAEQYRAALRYVPDRLAALEGLARLAIDEDRLRDARRYLVLATREERAGDRIDAAIEELDRRIEAGGEVSRPGRRTTPGG